MNDSESRATFVDDPGLLSSCSVPAHKISLPGKCQAGYVFNFKRLN